MTPLAEISVVSVTSSTQFMKFWLEKMSEIDQLHF